MNNIVLLSGEPGVGKTTAIKKIIQMIGRENCSGFFTEEVATKSGRVGFDCVSLDGSRIRIADINLESHIRMGRYGIDIDAFESFALKTIVRSCNSRKITIIDEIGPIQFLSVKFKEEIKNILANSHFVLGTIFYKEHSEINEVKRLPGLKIIMLTKESRDSIPESVFAEMSNFI